jgi:predicted nucleotidyltransferase
MYPSNQFNKVISVSIPTDLKTLCTIAEISARASGAKKVILFGSVARGEAHADSDLDLLLLVEDSSFGTTLFEQLEPARKARIAVRKAGYRLPLECVPMGLEHFAREDSILAEVIQKEGIVIYG